MVSVGFINGSLAGKILPIPCFIVDRNRYEISFTPRSTVLSDNISLEVYVFTKVAESKTSEKILYLGGLIGTEDYLHECASNLAETLNTHMNKDKS